MADRTIRFHEFGGPEVLRFESLDAGDPGEGELRVRIEAIDLNRAEASFRSGRYVEKAQHGPALAEGLSMRGYLVFELIHDAKRFAAARGFVEEGLRAGALAPTIGLPK